MEIFPDPMHVVMLTLPFLTTLVGLHLILWKPLLGYLEERAETSSRARHESHELEGAASELLTKIDARLIAARQHITGVRQTSRLRALAKEAEIIAQTRVEADQKLSAALKQLASDKADASNVLRNTTSELSNQIAARVLGRSLDGPAA